MHGRLIVALALIAVSGCASLQTDNAPRSPRPRLEELQNHDRRAHRHDARANAGRYRARETNPRLSGGALAQRTWLFVREFIGTLLVDRNKIITENDAMDLMHAVVPVAYCDFALLDSKWKHRVAVVRRRLQRHKIPLKPAEVFSSKRGGLEQFLERLKG